jgi:hypothetical protein
MRLISFRKLGELLGTLTVSGVASLKHKAISSQVDYFGLYAIIEL